MRAIRLLCVVVLGCGALASPAVAQTSGSWNVNNSGTWSVGTNWLGGTIANGVDGTATFGFNITSTRTVTLDSDRTIGNLVFSDNGSAGSAWILTGSTGATTLTLATSSGTPQITVTTNTVIGVVLGGTQGITFAGSSTVSLSNASVYTGGTTIAGGTLQIGTGGTSGGITGDVLNNANLQFNRSDLNSFDGVISGTGNLTKLGAGTTILTKANTFNGTTQISAGAIRLADNNALQNSTVSVDANLTFSAGINAPTIAGLTGLGTIALRDGNNNGVVLTVGGNNVSTTFGGIMFDVGGLVKVGNGTLTLTSDNTYSGGTTISAGTLQLGNGGSSGSITGNILNNAALAVNTAGTPQLNGVISGTGSLTLAGGGLLFLNGANTFSGLTAVNAGTIVMNNGNALQNSEVRIAAGGAAALGFGGGVTTATIGGLSGLGNLTVNIALNVGANNASTTFGGQVGGNGTITKVGAGTLTFTNSVFHSTIIATGGTLQFGNGGAPAATLPSNITDNAQVIFNHSGGATFGGVISGTGGVTFAGTGTTLLTGNNTYSGGTTITSATLQIGNGGGSGAIVGNVLDNGLLAFASPITTTMNGQITGTGGLVQAGGFGSKLVLTAANSYSGGTTIASGALQIGNGDTTSSLAGNIAVFSNAALLTNHSGTLTLDGVISGVGGTLQNSGPGNLVLTASNAFFGQVILNGGSIVAANNNALSGGVLQMVGSVSTLTFAAGVTAPTLGGLFSSGNGTLRLNDAVGAPVTLTLAVPSGSFSGSFSGSIAGIGNLSLTGNVTETFQGTNTYTGHTTIAGGAKLSIGSGGTAGSIVSDVTNNSVLLFNRSNDMTYTGSISGTGGVTKLGAGALSFGGVNVYTGGTTVSAGTLEILNGSSLPLTGNVNVQSGASFIVDSGGSLTGTGAVTGAGRFVNNGTLNADVTTQHGSVVQGNGTIHGTVTINSGATISPGNSVGSLAIDNLTLNSSSVDPSVAVFEFKGAAGTLPGTDWDYLDVSSGILTVNATQAAPMTLKIDSWNSDNSGHGGAPGPLWNGFDPSHDYSWLWINASSLVLSGSDPINSRFLIVPDTAGSGVFGSGNPYVQPNGGHFFVSTQGNSLYINYSAVPEPGSLLLAALAAAGAYARRRRASA